MAYDAVTLTTPLGHFTAIAEAGALVAAGFTGDPEALRPRLGNPAAALHVHDDLGQISRALAAYFDGSDVTAIDSLPVRMAGTPAMRRLWEELRRIPAGQVRSYAELGGERRYARAAGAACARNPVPLVVPCHRVVRGDGTLGGFGWGLETKRWLLDHEARFAEPEPGPRQLSLSAAS
ncbi:MAG TPA: methylated-DNA--[protein]-cysteine S-methyltransferase [Candidatus Binatia bacterium]|nr:methylated-DNA--[protein]-cysteine S-methyltransferase [Candidatus Binatia bacterium]